MPEFFTPVAAAHVSDDGLDLLWTPSQSREADYIGPRVPWSNMKDVDTAAAPPQVRLINGRTLFVAAEHRDVLASHAARASIREATRPDVWAVILEPYLDTAFDRRSNRSALDRHGIPGAVVRRARRRLRIPMMRLTVLTWEWQLYGQVDAISAYANYGPHSEGTQANFRLWTDAVANADYSRKPSS